MSAAKPRVAWWSPLPPHHSGVADYSAELLPHLGAHWEIDLFVDRTEVDASLSARHRLIDIREIDAASLHDDYDAVIYHIGNGPAHIYVYRALLQAPGLVVLHDVSLTHLVAEITHGRGRTDLLFREMREQHGDDAAEDLRRYVYLHEPAPWLVEPLRLPLNRRVIAAARAMIVHSEFAKNEVQPARPDLAIEVIEMHAPAPAVDVPAPRSGDPGLTLCTAGYLTPAKRLESVLRALADLRGRIPFRYHVVGEFAPAYGVAGLVRDLGLGDHVRLHGRVSPATLDAFLARADLCINLRHPTSGETSAMVMRALACGSPVVVSEGGWFAELPDDAVVKITAGDDEVKALAGVVEALERDPERLRKLAAGARRYARSRDPASRAECYAAFVAQHRTGASARAARALALPLANAARDLGFDADLVGAMEIAEDLAATGAVEPRR